MPVGDDRGPRRRPQGARRVDRRVPGVHRVLGGSAAGLPSAAGCGPRCWPWATARWDSGRRCGRCSRTTREQRCWFHKMANVLAALPKSAHPAATRAMQEIFNAEDGDHARVAAKAFAIDYGAKFPKAVAKITDDLDVLLEFYNYPAEHWIHLRTTNPIESTFATVRHRSKVTKGPGSRAAGLAMAFKLIEAAQAPLAVGQRTPPRRPRPRRRHVPPAASSSNDPPPASSRSWSPDPPTPDVGSGTRPTPPSPQHFSTDHPRSTGERPRRRLSAGRHHDRTGNIPAAPYPERRDLHRDNQRSLRYRYDSQQRVPAMRNRFHPRRAPPMVLRCLPPIRLATPSGRTPTRPTRQDRHRLRMPAMPDPLPRRPTLPGLQHLVPPPGTGRPMPALR